ncbi:hypothetical protein ACH4OY_17920 [Micromonospora rubida]|uniref:Polysaccharide biosynthesis protein C-terminal domain-containing protein n=1 Tax=Micromonospora rubida TaxID=2697657 RepID=A0ABW7SLF9_9ACTN
MTAAGRTPQSPSSHRWSPPFGTAAPKHRCPRLPRRITAPTRHSLVAASTNLLNGLLNAALLGLSARHGQTDEIAAYVAVTAALTLVSIAVAGGSPLLYISGDAEQRRAVRSQWVFVTLPCMVLGTVAIGSFYSRTGYEWPAMVAIALVTIGNHQANFQLGDLARDLRFVSTAVAVCGCKVPALAMVALGGQLSTALLVATVIQFLAAEAFLGRASWLRPRCLAELSPRSALSAFRMNRHLFTYSIAEYWGARMAAVLLSLLVTPQVMGAFGAVLSVYQAQTGVLTAALRVSMVGRVRRRQGLGSAANGRQGEVVAIAGAALIAVVSVIAAPWIVGDLLRLPPHGPALWLILLAVALPFMLVVRAVTLNQIGDASYRRATRIMVLNAALTTPVALTAVPLAGATGAAIATLAAEVLTGAVLGLALLRRQGRLYAWFLGPAERTTGGLPAVVAAPPEKVGTAPGSGGVRD